MARWIGWLLRPFRAGDKHLAWNSPAFASAPETIRLTSPAFADGAPIPPHHAGEGVGENASPALEWSGIPPGTEEIVIILEDPDVPLPRPFIHLVASAIPAHAEGLPEGALNAGGALRLARSYAGPRALPGHGPHRYIFQIAALGTPLQNRQGRTLKRLLAAARGHVLARGRLTGTFERT